MATREAQYSQLCLPYFDLRDSPSVMDGIVVKGEAVVIPSELRASIKKRLHSAHLCRGSMLRRARGVVFWPGVASDINTLLTDQK